MAGGSGVGVGLLKLDVDEVVLLIVWSRSAASGVLYFSSGEWSGLLVPWRLCVFPHDPG